MHNMVIISFLTVSLIDHASNMRCHLELCRLEKHHIVFAADKRAFESLKIWNFNVWPAFGLVDTDPSIERVHVSFLVIFHRPSFLLIRSGCLLTLRCDPAVHVELKGFRRALRPS